MNGPSDLEDKTYGYGDESSNSDKNDVEEIDSESEVYKSKLTKR